MANLYRNLRLPILILALCCASGDARGGEGSRPPCWHRVKRGETLARIARKYYGRTEAWKLIKRANRGLNERNLKIGQRIFIPAPHGAARPPQPEPTPAAAPTPTELSPGEGSAESGSLVGNVMLNFFPSLIGFAISFLASCLLLWWTSKLLRNPLRLQNTSFKRAALGNLLCHIFGTLAVAAVMALSALVFLTGMEKEAAGLVWSGLVGTLGLVVIVAVDCLVLARVYRTQLVGGLFLLVVWVLLGCMVYCLAGSVFMILGMLIAGNSLFALS